VGGEQVSEARAADTQIEVNTTTSMKL